MNDEDDSREEEGSDRDISDLPKIIVEGDKIIVLDNPWEESNVDEEDESEVEVEVGDLVLTEDGLNQVLEDIVGGEDSFEKESSDSNDVSYEIEKRDIGGLYDSDGGYDSGAGKIDYDMDREDLDIKASFEAEDARKDRSILEQMGFRDKDAEERRERKRDSFI
jgi:hypothetical protein